MINANLTNITIMNNNFTNIPCNAIGNPIPSTWIEQNGIKLTIIEKSGQYMCMAENEIGKNSQKFQAIVFGKIKLFPVLEFN